MARGGELTYSMVPASLIRSGIHVGPPKTGHSSKGLED